MTVMHGDSPDLDMQVTVHKDRDAGADAADRIRTVGAAIAYNAKVALKRLIITCIVLTIAALAGVIWYGYETRVLGTTTDTRTCEFEIGKTKITAVRSYTYPYQEYYGFHIRDNSKIYEKTVMALDGTQLIVLGNDAGTLWSYFVDSGDRGQFIMKSSDEYTFIVGKQADKVNYKSFCK